jgi:diadenosine tetraphosphate (Ap4A) HIT family hydrolase
VVARARRHRPATLAHTQITAVNGLSGTKRSTFLQEMAAIGDALLAVTSAVRINYEILGNTDPALHAHVFPRYSDEPDELKSRPVWFYDWQKAPSFDLDRDEPLMRAIRAQLTKQGLTVSAMAAFGASRSATTGSG